MTGETPEAVGIDGTSEPGSTAAGSREMERRLSALQVRLTADSQLEADRCAVLTAGLVDTSWKTRSELCEAYERLGYSRGRYSVLLDLQHGLLDILGGRLVSVDSDDDRV